MVQPFNKTLFKLVIKNFNTSYVMVQRRFWPIDCGILTNFNTSYVMVQRLELWQQATKNPYFNTSYVMVQLFIFSDLFVTCQFQYILCYGSTTL